MSNLGPRLGATLTHYLPRPTDRVLIVGAGRLGQLVAQVLALTGCELQIVACHETQRALLAGRHVTLTTEDTVPCQKMDVVVEATGSPKTQ